MSTVVQGMFQDDGQQLVGPKTIAAWQQALGPAHPETKELTLSISEEHLGDDPSLYQNFPLSPLLVARVEALTGIKAKTSATQEDGTEEESVFESVSIPFVEPSQAELPNMPKMATEQTQDGLTRAPATIVDAWLEFGLDEEWDDLVRGGRSKDGSWSAHPGNVAALVELTGIGDPGDFTTEPFMTVEDMRLVALARGVVERFENSDDFVDGEARSRVIGAIQQLLGKALTEPDYLENSRI